MKKVFVIFAVLLLVLGVASCKKKPPQGGGDTPGGDNPGGGQQQTTTYKITYELNGGTLGEGCPTSYDGSSNVALGDATKAGFKFEGWFENAECTGTAVRAIKKGSSGDKKYYAKWSKAADYQEKWNLNEIGFDGNGMTVVIKVLPVTEYDPFNAGYTGESKAIKQAHQLKVQNAYNIKIEYSAWDNEAPWGPDRVNFIKNSYVDSSFQKKGVYIITITSQWIPTLVKAGCLAELYNNNTGTGIFEELTFGGEKYEQNAAISDSCSVNKKVYGYSYGAARPDYFLYYNATLAAQAGMIDPAELWFRGEWTWSTFDSWVRQAQTNLAKDQYVIDAGYAPFIIGAVAGQGNKMISGNGTIYFTKASVTNVIDKIQGYYQNGFWNKAHGVQDVSTDFVAGNTIFQDGSLWYLKESTRFDPESIKFEVGCVPYPTSDSDNVMTSITEPYTYTDTQGNQVSVTEPLKTRTGETLVDATGKAIYGIDLSETSYQCPFTGTSCYSIMETQNGANGINNKVIFSILHDLVAALGDDPEKIKQTNDEAYEAFLTKKFDSEIYPKVLMSIQDESLSYYELMETASMTAGDGSHYGANGWWVIASGLCTKEVNAQTALKEVYPAYVQALKDIGIL